MTQTNCRHRERRGGGLASRLAAFLAALLLTLGYSAAHDPAAGVPAFARQTGQPCASCHTSIPQLTPFGRRFKIGGYTLQGGDVWREFPQLSVLLAPTFTHNALALPYPPSPNGGFTGTNNLSCCWFRGQAVKLIPPSVPNLNANMAPSPMSMG